jgi:hypothetical protein
MEMIILEVKIERISSEVVENLCFLDSGVYSALEISEEKLYRLHLGKLSLSCCIRPHKTRGQSLYLSEDIINQLCLDDKLKLNIWRKEQDVYMGPVVGLFVTARYFKAIFTGKIPIGVIEHIEEAGPYANCLSYCFCAEDVNLAEGKIKGYTFNQNKNKWEHRWLPVPDVIYDRAAYLSDYERNRVYELREKFWEDPDIQFINTPGSLGKWQLYRHLSKHAEMLPYLPETIRYRRFNDLIFMLDKHGFIFLKSSFGSRGEEVLSVDKTEGRYRIDYFDGKLKVVYVEDVEELRAQINKFIEEKQETGRVRFIVQQGLRLIKYNGHNMDLRIHIVKNEEGKWEATNSYGIYSKGNSTITNFCVGGDFNLYERIYPSLKEQHPHILIPTVEEVAMATIMVGTFIEKEFGTFGEIGMDMAIDEKGKLWFIEGNAKPDKYRTPGIDDMNGPAPQALAIFKYAKYLVEGI